MSSMFNTVAIQLADDQTVTESWIQIMTLGKYKHPGYGKIVFTPERLQRFADSVNNQITGIQPDVDYDHKAKVDYAAGWISKAEVRPDGLWALVEWTPKAFQAIKDKEYKYFSPEFVDSWENPKTGQKFTDVLRGGAITNRPFLKDIAQLQLSEDTNEGKFMDPKVIKKLAEDLGLPETATEEDVVAALIAEHDKVDEESSVDETDADKSDKVVDSATLSEKDKSKLLSDPVTAKLVGIMEAQNKTLSEQTKKFKEMEVSSAVAKLSETAAAKNVLIPGKIKDKITKFFSEYDSAAVGAVSVILSDIIETGLVPAGEIAGGRQVNTGSDPVKKFSEAVSALMLSDKISYGDAAIKIANTDPELFDAYRTESYAG